MSFEFGILNLVKIAYCYSDRSHCVTPGKESKTETSPEYLSSPVSIVKLLCSRLRDLTLKPEEHNLVSQQTSMAHEFPLWWF